MGISLSQFDVGPSPSSLDREAASGLAQRLDAAQARLRAAPSAAFILIEGWNEASRAGAVQALAARWDPRFVRAWAQFPHDPKQHLLSPAWRTLPEPGEITLYEGGWYASVLDGRLSGRLNEQGWKRHYDEINEFEAQQTDHGLLCFKFFLHQCEKAQNAETNMPSQAVRATTPREMVMRALEEQLDWTDTRWAPWTIINADEADLAYVGIFEHVAAGIERSTPERVETVTQDS